MRKEYFFIGLILLFVIWAGYYYNDYLSNINPTLLTIISGGLGYAISKFYEEIKESKQRIYEQKRKFYNDLIAPFRDLLKNIKSKKGSQEFTDRQISSAMDAAFDNILYASDDVIKLYGQFRNNSQNTQTDNNQYKTLKLFAHLLLAMRKDLGNKMSNLNEIQILRMFINMSELDEKNYQREFDKIKINRS